MCFKLITSFIKCTISYNENSDGDEYEYARKIMSILINNYSEIMRVPNDIADLVHDPAIDKNILTEKPNSIWTSKASQRDDLVKKLLNLLTDINLNDEEKFMRLKQASIFMGFKASWEIVFFFKFKETYPNIYEEKYTTIKKAVNVLGLNEVRPATVRRLTRKRSLTNAIVNTASNAISATQNSTMISFPKFSFPKTLKKK